MSRERIKRCKRVDSYDLMVRSLLGPVWGTSMEILIAVYQFGACVVYVLYLVDQLEPLLKCGLCGGDCCEIRPVDKSATCSCDSFWCKRTIVILLNGFSCFSPIMHSISKLKFVSLLGVMCPFIMASIIVYFGIDEMVEDGLEANFDNVQWFTNTPKGVFVAIPIFCFVLQSRPGSSDFQRIPEEKIKLQIRHHHGIHHRDVSVHSHRSVWFDILLEKSPDNFPKDLLTGFKTNEILANVARYVWPVQLCAVILKSLSRTMCNLQHLQDIYGKRCGKMDPGSRIFTILLKL